MVSFPDPRSRHPFHMHDMIHGQPAFVAETLRRLEAVEPLALVREARRIVVTGCGTSFHAAQIGARLLADARGGRAGADAIHAYDLLYGPAVPKTALVIGVSHSGQTPTTNRAIARCRRAGARTLAVIGLPDSPMGRLAHRTIVLGSVHDRSWANTMSYTTQLAAFAALARGLEAGGPSVAGAIRSLPSRIRGALAGEPAIRRLARALGSRSRVTFLGTGLDEVTALEAALKIRETCSLPATGYHTEQLLHGPFLSLDARDAVVALRSSEDGWRVDAILDGLAETGARVARIGDGGRVGVRLPRVSRDLRPIVSVVPMQLLAYHAALARGANPDIMRTDVARYGAGIEELFTWRPRRRTSSRPSKSRGRSAG